MKLLFNVAFVMLSAFLLTSCDNTNPQDPSQQIVGFALYRGETEVYRLYNGELKVGGKLTVPLGQTSAVHNVYWITANEKIIAKIPSGWTLHLKSGNPTAIAVTPAGSWAFTITGNAVATVNLEIGILDGNQKAQFLHKTLTAEVK